MVEKIYRYFANISFIRFCMSITSFIIRFFSVKVISNNYLVNIEWFHTMNIIGFNKERKEWISWILRTKNWWKFLEEVVKSCIESLDELIIINNLSTDNTRKISLNLIKKYWDKVKYYEYNYNIVRKKKQKSNSIHSLAYFYNWCFSKSNYKIVWKIDDDGLFLTELFHKNISKIKNSNAFFRKNIFFYYWWLNFYKKENTVWVVSSNPYSWKYWDIWFYSISNKTYYYQEGFTEKFISNKFYINLGFSYLHMKYFKDEKGLKYAPLYLKKYFSELLNNTKLDKVEKYTKSINHNKCINIIKKIISNNP